MTDQTAADAGLDEAMFMFGACASFAAYLANKHRQTERKKGSEVTTLQNRVALHRFVCHEFGYLGGMSDMLDRLRDLAAGFDAGGESEYATALGLYRHPTRTKVTPEQLARVRRQHFHAEPRSFA